MMSMKLNKNITPARAAMDFTSICDMLSADFFALNRIMNESLQSSVSLIPAIGSHLINAGGKRIRPMLIALCARMMGCEDVERIARLGASIEFVHGATLLHDDVIDESYLRRGVATANAVWDNTPSVLAGDFLFARSFQLIVMDGSIEVMETLSKVAATIVEGEMRQLHFLGNLSIDECEYLSMIELKTASLFDASTKVGAIIAGADKEAIESMSCLGRSIGMLFQIQDDLLDYFSDAQTLGKNVGDDFRGGKNTLPVIFSYHADGVTEEEKHFWQRTIGRLEQYDGDFNRAISLMRHHSSYDRSYAVMKKFADVAYNCVDSYDNIWADAIRWIIGYNMKRSR
jgi:octaprenyl-diphosphate synthase